jgi:putative sterol carrier protein
MDLSSIPISEVIKLVGAASDEQLQEGMASDQRGQILAEVFKQMSEHYRPGSNPADAVIHWKITGKPDGGEDGWTATLKEGKCTTTEGLEGDPRVTFKMDGPTFLRLVTGNAQGPMLFISGKLKIEGDIPFAAQAQSLFEIPS